MAEQNGLYSTLSLKFKKIDDIEVRFITFSEGNEYPFLTEKIIIK